MWAALPFFRNILHDISWEQPRCLCFSWKPKAHWLQALKATPAHSPTLLFSFFFLQKPSDPKFLCCVFSAGFLGLLREGLPSRGSPCGMKPMLQEKDCSLVRTHFCWAGGNLENLHKKYFFPVWTPKHFKQQYFTNRHLQLKMTSRAWKEISLSFVSSSKSYLQREHRENVVPEVVFTFTNEADWMHNDWESDSYHTCP